MGCQDILSVPLILLTSLLPLRFATNKPSDDNDGKCELIGTFSLMTQAFLGLVCLSSLLIKRSYEYPVRRTWPVWAFDVSKQLIGALGVHIFNVILSMVKTAPEFLKNDSSGGGEDEDTQDPCDWYFLNIVLDCTIGVYILYLVFRAMNRICKEYFHWTQIESGEYGPNPNKPSYKAYLKQLGVYFTSLMITKCILYGLVECFEKQLLWITSHILLVWLDEYPDEFEIFIVMFIVPIIMNCLQLILIDNFIRNQLWINVNKRMRIEYPNFGDETESVQQREIYNARQEVECGSKYAFDDDTEREDTLIGRDKNHKNYGSYNEV
ncbi:hypothetical protein Cantr_03943 [Candida viswanathii]|uniref:Vacuolar membrane protein n=1 Tax=Candida viswanathii TaxID=5486 RepID=A0A367XPI9_9ASCO|nr:hypothetical protein Cantr_03943 [Candida viswanathii]